MHDSGGGGGHSSGGGGGHSGSGHSGHSGHGGASAGHHHAGRYAGDPPMPSVQGGGAPRGRSWPAVLGIAVIAISVIVAVVTVIVSVITSI